MATTTIGNPRMSFKYYYYDNGRYCNTSNRGRVFLPAQVMHYAETIYEAIKEAKTMTHGKPIEIWNRYGGFSNHPAATVYPDGSVTPSHYNINA